MEIINPDYTKKINGLIPETGEIDIEELWNGIKRKKKWLFLTTGIVFLGSTIFTIHSRVFKPVFQGSFSLLIMDPMNFNSGNKKPYQSSSDLFQGIDNFSDSYEINTLITLLKSPLFIAPIENEFNLSANSLKSNISINQSSKDSSTSISKGILNVYLNYKNPKIGQKILESLSENYLEASFQQKQQRLTDGLNFLNQQSPQILKKKDELQTKLVTFREKYKLIKPSEEGLTIKDKQKEADNQLTALYSERDRLMDVKNEIKIGSITARGFQKEMNAGLSISDFDQGLLQQLISVENELASAKSKYTNSSSIIKGLNLRLKQIQPLLLKNQLEAVDTSLKLNQGSINSTKKLQLDLEKEFLEQPVLIKQYQNLEQELYIANENLLSLVSARESFQLEMAQNDIPWKIISKPIMGGSPIEPNFQKNLLMGLLIGSISGAIIAIIRDKQDHVFYYPEEIKKDLNRPLLGHLPHINIFKDLRKEQQSILELLKKDISQDSENTKRDSYQRFFFQEAFRNLYTSIRFLDNSEKVKTIILSSSLPKEGKTLVNILLAKTIADLGSRILLIDADLRKPQIHYRLGLNNLLGFSNLLIDPKIEFSKVINKINNYDNWKVITGGTIPPDPTRLLGSQRFKDIMKEVKESGQFDVILIDAPPVLGLADSLLISEHVDGMIVLVGLQAVDRSLPKETINRVESVGTNLYGIVTNQTNKEKDDFSKRYGNSKYGLNYGGYRGYNYYSTYANYSDDDENKEKISYSSNENIPSNNCNEETKNFLRKTIQKIKKAIRFFSNWLEN